MVPHGNSKQSLQPAWWRLPRVRIVASAVFASFLAFAWTLDGYFLSEDFANVARFLDFPVSALPRLFVADWSGGIWQIGLPELRPVIAMSFIVDAQIWGTDAFGYRLQNLLVHAACAGLVGLIAYRATGLHETSGTVATILFALHPVHVHAVTPICGRGDLIVSAFYFAGFLAFLRYRERADGRWLVAFALIYALAVFSKEYGFTLAFLLFVADGTWLNRRSAWRQRSTWAPYACCLLLAVVYFACRGIAFGQSTAGSSGIEIASMSTWERLGQYHIGYIAHLLPPLAEWLQTVRERALAMHPWLPLQLGLVLLACAILACGWWRNRRHDALAQHAGAGLLFCIGLYLVATGPLVLTYFAPRHLYLASAGVCLAVVIVLRRATRSSLLFRAGAVAFSAVYLLQLELALQPWHQAATISRDVSREVARLTREAPPGSGIVMDVPAAIGEAVCWAWAMPFATQPPFVSPPVGSVVIGSPANYGFPQHWPAQPAIAALAKFERECWLVEVTALGHVRRRTVPAEKIRMAAAQLATVSSPEAAPWAYWKFIAELNAP